MEYASCENCGSKIEVGGLAPSVGGFDLYCVICGHTWHID